jgi:hypothetical protein
LRDRLGRDDRWISSQPVHALRYLRRRHTRRMKPSAPQPGCARRNCALRSCTASKQLARAPPAGRPICDTDRLDPAACRCGATCAPSRPSSPWTGRSRDHSHQRMHARRSRSVAGSLCAALGVPCPSSQGTYLFAGYFRTSPGNAQHAARLYETLPECYRYDMMRGNSITALDDVRFKPTITGS